MPAILFTADWDAVRESWLFQKTALYDTLMKLYYYGPYLLVLAGAWRLARRRALLSDPQRRAAFTTELLLVAFAGALLLLVTLNRPQDYVHLIVLYWPLLALGVVLAHGVLAGRPRWTAFAAVTLSLPAVVFVLYSARLVERLIARYSAPIENARAGIFVLPAEARLLHDVVDYVQTNTVPGEAVAVMPYFPILHFLAERPAPQRSCYIVWPFPEFPDRDRQMIAAMEAQPTRLVVYNFSQFDVFPAMEEFAPELFAYLVERFELERVFSYDPWGYMLGGLRRAADPPAGSALLTGGAGALAVSIESPTEPPRPVAPDARAGIVAAVPWPFRPVLALAPTPGGGRTVATLPLDVPAGVRLRTAVAVNPRQWYDDPFEVRFALEVIEDGRRETLYTRELSPWNRFDDRGWFEVDVPLDAWAGRRVTLAFSTAVDVTRGDPLLLAGWAEPRLVSSAKNAPQ